MSTKLYDAYKLPKMDLAEFFTVVEKLKIDIAKKQQNVFNDKFAGRALKIFDHKLIYPDSQVAFKEAYYSPGAVAQSRSVIFEWMRHEAKSKYKKEEMSDYYIHIHFLFYRGRIYATTRQNPWSKFDEDFKNLTGAEEYGYWNNTDQPKGVSRTQWQSREKEWDNVFGKDNSSWSYNEAHKCVKIVCDLDVGMQDWENVKLPQAFLESPERVKNMAETNVLRNKFKGQMEWPEVNRFMFSDEFRGLRKEESDRLLALLPKDVTIQQLLEHESVINKEGDATRSDFIIDFFV